MKRDLDSCPRPDLLVAFDEGVLPESLATGVRAHLEHCQLCAQLRNDLREEVFAEPTLAEVAEVRHRVFAGRKPEKAHWRRWAVAAAAVVLVSVGALYWQRTRLPEQQAAAPVSPSKPPVAPAQQSFRLALESAPLRLPFATALVVRGETGPVSAKYLKDLGAALEPYRARRFAEAAQALAALRTRYPAAVEAPFYEGVSLLLDGNAARAAAALHAAQAIGGEALNDDIAWYLAVAHEHCGDWTAAEPLLKRLCAAEGVHRQAACAAIEHK